MTIERIVEEAFRENLLARDMQAKLGRMLESSRKISTTEFEALTRLRGAILEGELRVETRRLFRNVTEELVWEALAASGAGPEELMANEHDIVAYALNRLPPLYATTELGAAYQRNRARQDLGELVAQRVAEAIEHTRERPSRHPERAPVVEQPQGELAGQVGALLHEYARSHELPAG